MRIEAAQAGQLADPQKHADVVRWCFAALTTVEPVISLIVLDGSTTSRRSRIR